MQLIWQQLVMLVAGKRLFPDQHHLSACLAECLHSCKGIRAYMGSSRHNQELVSGKTSLGGLLLTDKTDPLSAVG
ncbi:hypothetical protein D3C73_1376570 [compost metagenome]